MGQSAPSMPNSATSITKAHLIEAARNNSGIFQFTSARSLNNARMAGLTGYAQPGKRLNRTGIGQLLVEFFHNGNQPFEIGCGYRLMRIHTEPNQETNTNQQEFKITLEKDGQTQQVVYTLFHSENFDGRAIPAADLIKAKQALTDHQISQEECLTETQIAKKSQSNDQILSAMGVGRSAAVAVLQVFETEASLAGDLEGIQVESKIFGLIEKGRQQVSLSFVHSRTQEREIIFAAHEILNQIKERRQIEAQRENSSSPSDAGNSNRIESSSDDSGPLPATLPEEIEPAPPETTAEQSTHELMASDLLLKADKPYFENPRDFQLATTRFNTASNKINRQGNNRCYLSALNDIFSLNGEVDGVQEHEILLFQAIKIRQAYEESVTELRRARPLELREDLPDEERMHSIASYEVNLSEDALDNVKTMFSLEDANYGELMEIFPEHFDRSHLEPVHRSRSTQWINDHQIDALTLCLSYNELSQQIRERNLHLSHPYWRSLPQEISYIRLNDQHHINQVVTGIESALASQDPNKTPPKNMIILYCDHAAHAMQLDNGQWLATDYTKERPTSELRFLLQNRFNPMTGQMISQNASVLLIDSEFVSEFMRSQNRSDQALN